MSAYDTDYDSDTSNEGKPRQTREVIQPRTLSILEQIQMSLEDILGQINKIQNQLEDFNWETETVDVNEQNNHVRAIEIRLSNIQQQAKNIRESFVVVDE